MIREVTRDDIPVCVDISIFSNRMEILSHGGLPGGMTTDDFYEGISHPRNSTLMRIFLNIGLTEHTGHGVPTIIKKYGKEVRSQNGRNIHGGEH